MEIFYRLHLLLKEYKNLYKFKLDKTKTKKEAKKQEKGLLYRADAEPTLLGLIPSGWHEKICSKFWSSLFARVCAISWLV